MKKLIITGMAALSLLMGCKSELVENSPENAIGFDAYLNNITRSDRAGNISRIAVYGIEKDKDGQETLLFDKREIVKDGNDWNYAPTEYWTKNSAYWFTAFVPYEGNWLLEGPGDNIENTRGSLYFNNEKAGGQEDLIMALVERDAVEEASTEPEVGFNFTHQLSRIYFRFENGYPRDAAYSLKIKDITLHGVTSDGVMKVTSESAMWETGSSVFSIPLSLENEMTLHPSSREIAKTHSLFIIPGGKPMTVEFNVELFMNEGKDRLTSYRHQVVLPNIDMKKGFSYDLKAVIDEYNTNPDDSSAPLAFIVNEIEQWDETPEAGGGLI